MKNKAKKKSKPKPQTQSCASILNDAFSLNIKNRTIKVDATYRGQPRKKNKQEFYVKVGRKNRIIRPSRINDLGYFFDRNCELFDDLTYLGKNIVFSVDEFAIYIEDINDENENKRFYGSWYDQDRLEKFHRVLTNNKNVDDLIDDEVKAINDTKFCYLGCHPHNREHNGFSKEMTLTILTKVKDMLVKYSLLK